METSLTRTETEIARSPASVSWREVMETWLDATAGSQETRQAYTRAVTEMFDYLGVFSAWDVSAQALAAYRAVRLEQMDDPVSPLAPATISLKLTAARSFLTFASTVGAARLRPEVISRALASFRHTVVRPYDVLSAEEQECLVAWARGNRAPRDALMIELMLAVGLRVGEVVELKRGDLTRDEEGDTVLRVRMGKGRKDRLVPLPGDLASRLLALGNGAHVFTSHRGGGGLTERRVQQVVHDCVVGCGIDRDISPHSLRHTFAIGRLRAGVSLVVVQKLLGHASLKTTERYLDHIGMDELKVAVGV